MASRLLGKVAIVTGAGSQGPGIGNGKATAVLFRPGGCQGALRRSRPRTRGRGVWNDCE